MTTANVRSTEPESIWVVVQTILLSGIIAVLWATTLAVAEQPVEQSIAGRVQSRTYPSIFQAWNPIHMPGKVPLGTLDDRLRAAARHDLMWEEPVSQLGYGAPLVLGAVWNHKHGGLATDFTPESKRQALINRKRMLEMNPRMVFLLEVRWREAPGSFLPEDSPFWKRALDGTPVKGWDGASEPYYRTDPDNRDFAANIIRQCKIAVDSGIYDGIMFDCHGHMPIVKELRETLGDRALIICNINDQIDMAEKYKGLINGAFLESCPEGPGSPEPHIGTWESVRKTLAYCEENFAKPRVNCLHSFGDPKDLRRMRVVTTLGLTHSDGYVLFAKPNLVKTPENADDWYPFHAHDWYPFWDAEVGRPAAKCVKREDGAYQREFERGTVVYNPIDNRKAVTVQFDSPRKRVSDGTRAVEFSVQSYDGDIFLK